MRKYLIKVESSSPDEDFMLGGAGGYDDIDMLTRLRWHGIIEDRCNDIAAIHLDHFPPPPEVQKPELVMKNYELMQSKIPEYKTKWQANVGREWGVLKPRP